MMQFRPEKHTLTDPHPFWDRLKHWWIWLLAAILLGIVLYTQLTKPGQKAAGPGQAGDDPQSTERRGHRGRGQKG